MKIRAYVHHRRPRGHGLANLGLGLLLAAFLSSTQALAHGGQIEIGNATRGPVTLTPEQEKALGLRLATAAFRPLDTVLNLNGEVELLPNKQADVTLRISGQITALYANLGDHVRIGQKLARVQSRLVGDPPPSVVITAPMGGIIDQRPVILGQAVEPNTMLFHISERTDMRVVAKVYEQDLAKVKDGQTARVRLLSYPDRMLTGKVIFVDPNLDPQSRTVKVWVLLHNPGDLLKPSMFARVTVVLGHTQDALTIPNSAILEAEGEKFVFVKEGSKFHRVDVTLGASDAEYSEITHGLVPADQVVTEGVREIYTFWLTGGQLKSSDGD
ncbi:MAG: efflux RND transporter periplasmic adaptor subunit [Acidiferrobacterales bacterium]